MRKIWKKDCQYKQKEFLKNQVLLAALRTLRFASWPCLQ